MQKQSQVAYDSNTEKLDTRLTVINHDFNDLGKCWDTYGWIEMQFLQAALAADPIQTLYVHRIHNLHCNKVRVEYLQPTIPVEEHQNLIR